MTDTHECAMTDWPDYLVEYHCRLCGGVSDLAVTDAHLPDGRLIRSVLCRSCMSLAIGTSTEVRVVG